MKLMKQEQQKQKNNAKIIEMTSILFEQIKMIDKCFRHMDKKKEIEEPQQ